MRIGLILAALTLTACATGYQAKGLTGGYRDAQLSENIFMVTFEGNAYTDKDRANGFAMLRAAEITRERGYTHFKILSSQDKDRQGVMFVPSTSSTTGTVSSGGRTANYVATTTQPQAVDITRPGSQFVFQVGPAPVGANDGWISAEFATRYIKADLGLE
jgi:hypothetical protein